MLASQLHRAPRTGDASAGRRLDPGPRFMRRGARMVNMFRSAGLLALLCLIALVTPARAEAPPATSVITQFYDTLVDVMKQGRTLGFDGRYARLKPAIETTFN